jgi:streptogrisin C
MVRPIKAALAATATAALAIAGAPQTMAAPAAQGAEPTGTTMLGAMQRDLGLSESQARARVAQEDRAARDDAALQKSLGKDYAGSWFDARTGKLVVAVSDPTAKKLVRARGAVARTVTFSSAKLDRFAGRLDSSSAPAGVAGWYVDVTTNEVVIPTSGDVAAAEKFAAAAGVPAAAVRAEESNEAPRPLAQGGDRYTIDNTYVCSIGFAVSGGFVTAGHCGGTGSTTATPSGSFAGSSFPGNDYAFVQTSESISPTVNNYAGGSVAVRGSAEAPIGSSICRSGQTSGWNCGTIQARNATVNYAQGSVYGLIRTSACAEPGDSGGSAISGDQAQGVTSGGSGDCTSGGTTYFQPVNEILGAYGLSLTTS